MEHIMLDLETLDTGNRALILSIGAIAFEPTTKELGERFYVELVDDAKTQEKLGRTISTDTVRWWMQQNVLAKRVFASPPATLDVRASTYAAAMHFSEFAKRNGGGGVKVWGNGADFDNVILGSLYEDLEMPRPWKYSNNRCYRTMRELIPSKRHHRTHAGTSHNALDDAVTQAIHLQEILKCLDPQL